MLKALLWKEWHEQRGRMALATVWLLGMTAIGLKTRILPDETILNLVWIPTALILPVFLGMGLFASERKAGTLAYLLVQPVDRDQILIAKLIIGVAAYILPFTVCGFATCLAIGGREISTASLIAETAIVVGFGTVLLAWQLLAGIGCRREEAYVLTSAAVIGGWILYIVIVEEWLNWSWPLVIHPLAFLDLLIYVQGYWADYDAWITIIVQGLILVGLGFGLRFRVRRLQEGRS
jgi:hypothetical protein